MAYETQINQLKRESQTQLSRISSLETELELAEEMVDPEVVALEQEIRQRVMLEARAETQRTTSRVNLVKELSSLDPMEMAQLMQIQGQYGRFLQSLNVDDERLETITDALMNQISEQNQRRQELLQARMANPSGDMNSIRQQMIEISSPQAQREALSYIFTDEEMEMFDTFQQSQLNQQVPFGVSSRAVIADPTKLRKRTMPMCCSAQRCSTASTLAKNQLSLLPIQMRCLKKWSPGKNWIKTP